MKRSLLALAAAVAFFLTEPVDMRAQWIDTLPPSMQQSILWSADHEDGSLFAWDFGGDPDAGGGIFNTGEDEVEAVASTDVAHSGNYSARATITGAVRAQNGSRAVRLMRWTDTHWALGGDFLPASAYYSVWVYFPEPYNPNKYEPWDPGDGGWWNLFQFKSDDAQGISQPMFALNLDYDDATGLREFYLYSNYNPPLSFGQISPRPVPVGQWIHLEAFYQASPTDGRITIWQDGDLILDVPRAQTVRPGGDEQQVWGIGNYTDHIAGGQVEGTASVYFDDAIVSTLPVSWTSGVTSSPAALPAIDLSASPNPFRGQTTIRFAVETSPATELTIHDLRGRLVRALPLTGDIGQVRWRGNDQRGTPVAAGTYYLRLKTSGGTTLRPLRVLR